MLGGGTFTTQNKIIPGAYMNFISSKIASGAVSDRGVAAIALELNWGKDGEVFAVTEEDIVKSCRKLFGYSYTDAAMSDIRDIFMNATKVYFYKLTSGGEKASCDYADAKYCGTRGNDIKIVIESSVDVDGGYDVKTFLSGSLVDSQIVKAASELKENDYVTFKEFDMAVTAGTSLTGGTNGTVTGESHSDFLDKAESYSFNVLGCKSEDETVKRLYVSYTKRMRNEVGAKFVTVLFDYAADYEGVINVKNSSGIIPWVTGAQAGCAINKSLTNRIYDGEASVAADYTQSQLAAAIKAGEFVLHKVNDEIRVLEDINSFVTQTEEKNELFQSNQTIRVIDQIAVDIAGIFKTKYLGTIQNNASGRMGLWLDIVKHHKSLEKLGAIEEFQDSDVKVSQGEKKGSVYVTDAVTVTNAMDKLYMVVTIN